MKNAAKMGLAVAALMSAASAQAYVNGDLYVGFAGGGNGAQGASDYIYDLGHYTALYDGQTWNVGSGRNTQFGVVGSFSSGPSVQHIFATSSDAAESGWDPSYTFGSVDPDVRTIAGGLSVGNFRTTSASDGTGWTAQTIATAPGVTWWNDSGLNPNVSTLATAYLFDNLDNGNNGTASAVTLLGTLSYDSGSGTMLYTVPEPSGIALFGGMGALLLAFRRRFARS
jgi:hypothetical protein